MEFPGLPGRPNGSAGPSADLTCASGEAKPATEVAAQTQDATATETPTEDIETVQSSEESNIPRESSAGPAPSTKVAEAGDMSNGENPIEEAITADTTTDKTEKWTVKQDDETCESLTSDTSENEEEDHAQTSDEAKDDMREDNIRFKRTKLSPPRTLEMTLFDRLEKMYGAGIKRLLAVQYR